MELDTQEPIGSSATEEEKPKTSPELDLSLKIDAVFSLAAADGPDTSPEKQPFVKLKDKSAEDENICIAGETNYEQNLIEKEQQNDVDEIEVTPTKDVQMEQVNHENIETSHSTEEERIGLEKAHNIMQEEQSVKVTTDENNHMKQPVVFRPCYVVLRDVIEHEVMQQELHCLRTKEEKLKMKLAKQKEVEEIKAQRQRALRGYNSTSFAPFVEDPEEILKKKGCKALNTVTDTDKSANAKDKVIKKETPLPSRRSSRRLHLKSDQESTPTTENLDEGKSRITEDGDNEKVLDLNDSDGSNCRPSRKRKVSALLSGKSFILDVRGINTVWQETMEMEKKLEAEAKKRANHKQYYSVYRLGYGRLQVARTRAKLHSKRREDMPFVNIKLDREQISDLSAIPPNPQLSPKHPLPDMKYLPFYVKMDLKMEETPRGSFKIWKSPKSKSKSKTRDKKKKYKCSRDNMPVKKVETKDQPTLQGHTSLKRKLTVSSEHTIDKVPKEDLKADDTDVSHERVPCSLVGRCRKPSSKYSSGFVTRFHRHWKTDVIKARKIKREVEKNDSNDEMTDSASETQDIESRNVSPCKDVKSEPSDAEYYGVKCPETLQSKPHSSSVTCTTTAATTIPVAMAGTSKGNISNSSGIKFTTPGGTPVPVIPNNYPNGFMNTVAQLAKEQNTKKFLQLRIGDKIVLIATDGFKAMPKAFVMSPYINPLNPSDAGSHSLQNVQTPSVPTQALSVPSAGVKIAPKTIPTPAVPTVVNTAPTLLLNPLSTQQGAAPFHLPIVKEEVVTSSSPIYQHPVISQQPGIPSVSSFVKPSAQTPVLQNIHSPSSNQGLLSASSMLSTLSSAAMTDQSAKKDNVQLKSLLSKAPGSCGLPHSNNKPTTFTNPPQVLGGLIEMSQTSTTVQQHLSQHSASVSDKKDMSSLSEETHEQTEEHSQNSLPIPKEDNTGDENETSIADGKNVAYDKKETSGDGSNENKNEQSSIESGDPSPEDVEIETASADVTETELKLDRRNSNDDAEAEDKDKNEKEEEDNSPADNNVSDEERNTEESDVKDIHSCPKTASSLVEKEEGIQVENTKSPGVVRDETDAELPDIVSAGNDEIGNSKPGAELSHNCDVDTENDIKKAEEDDVMDSVPTDYDKLESHQAAGEDSNDNRRTEGDDTSYSQVSETDVDLSHVTERGTEPERDVDEDQISGKEYADGRQVTDKVVDEGHVTDREKEDEVDDDKTEQGNECDAIESASVDDDETKDNMPIKCELPDNENVTHVPANETVVEERIRKLREKLRAKQAELDSFRKNIQSKVNTDGEMS